MTREAIEEAINRKPFRPFSLRLADGQLVQVNEAYRAAVHPDVETMVIFEATGGYRILDIPLITGLQAA